ncbi:hypothetical protein Tco_1432383, partial [Tanacetum coccineum]
CLSLVVVSKNVETIENVIEDESHFVIKAVNNDLGGGGFVVLGGTSSRESKSACGEVGGVEKMSSTRSKIMVKGEECLEGCVGAGGGEIFRDDGGAVWKSVGGDRAWYRGDDG